jgi:hypothetical protein
MIKADMEPSEGRIGDERREPATPRWVKVAAVLAVAAILVAALVILTGRGNHGPSRHTAYGDTGGGKTAERRAGPPPGIVHGRA